LEAAIEHIRRHGSGLAEAIVTNDLGPRARFTREVDAPPCSSTPPRAWWTATSSASAAEMGISTSRVHARGPVGVRELTTTKFIVHGRRAGRD
jgi:glutamate-5-semialdehyde dehydrogenase